MTGESRWHPRRSSSGSGASPGGSPRGAPHSPGRSELAGSEGGGERGLLSSPKGSRPGIALGDRSWTEQLEPRPEPQAVRREGQQALSPRGRALGTSAASFRASLTVQLPGAAECALLSGDFCFIYTYIFCLRSAWTYGVPSVSRAPRANLARTRRRHDLSPAPTGRLAPCGRRCGPGRRLASFLGSAWHVQRLQDRVDL